MNGSTFRIPLGGAPVRVRVEGDAAFLRRLRSLYPGCRAVKGSRADVVVDSRGVHRNGSTVFARGRTAARLAWTEWALLCAALPRLRGLRLHAAWVARAGRSALLAGGHGRGKTTLALALALRRGWRILADDLVLLGPGSRIRPVERPIRIKPGTSRALPETAAFRDAPLALGPGRIAVQPTAIVFLGARGRKGVRWAPLAEGMSVGRLAQLAGNLREDPAGHLAALARLVRRVRVAELRGGTLGERMRALEAFVPG